MLKCVEFFSGIGGLHYAVRESGIEYEMVANSLDNEVKIRTIQFYTIYENIKYSVECSLFSVNPDADMTIEMQKYIPLYKLVANSLVLNNRYK